MLGEMDNDMTMFEIAGVSIARGQASNTVKRHPSLVSSGNDDGFAIAIDALVSAHRCAQGTAACASVLVTEIDAALRQVIH